MLEKEILDESCWREKSPMRECLTACGNLIATEESDRKEERLIARVFSSSYIVFFCQVRESVCRASRGIKIPHEFWGFVL